MSVQLMTLETSVVFPSHNKIKPYIADYYVLHNKIVLGELSVPPNIWPKQELYLIA
jgi:hypothetical protein